MRKLSKENFSSFRQLQQRKISQLEAHTVFTRTNKRRGVYLIFRATSAALIRGRRLFDGGAYLKIVPDEFAFSIFLFNGTLSIC